LAFFDFNSEGNLSADAACRDRGTLLRQLTYRHLSDLLANKIVFDRLVQARWFPFVEIIGDEFKGLAAACEAGFELDDEEAGLLQRFDRDSAEQRAGAPNTLMFASEFAEYLEAYTFAQFDATADVGCAGSRHAVGHGAADPDTYTQVRALQALLTLDQLAFYT
jgi:hypothetical protein